MAHDRSTPGRQQRRLAVGRLDAAAKMLGLGIGLILGFFVLNLAHMPGSLERQADLERRDMLRAEAEAATIDSPVPQAPY